MTTVILAGGLGTRLQSVVSDVPKSMAPIAGKPFLEYLLLKLKKFGLNDIVLAVGYKAEVIESYFLDGNQLGLNIMYSKENQPLGTGGGLIKASKLINAKHFLVLNGDTFFDLDYNRLILFHKEKKAKVSVALTLPQDHTKRYGRALINFQGEIVGFLNQDSSEGYINTGVYIFGQEALVGLACDKCSLETEILPRFINKGLFGMPASGYFKDIGVPEDYLALCRNYSPLINAG